MTYCKQSEACWDKRSFSCVLQISDSAAVESVLCFGWM